MELNVKKLIVFPDIHGRTYWKSAVNEYKNNPEYGFIFLGDYFDPYPQIDGINEDMAMETWHALTDDLWDHERTIWLLGNHDWHYLPKLRREYGVRRSFKYFDIISNIFTNNFDKFNIAYEHNINGKKYIFTHAGITTGWAKHVYYVMNYDKPEITLNPYNEEDLIKINEESDNSDESGEYINAVYNADFLNSLKNNNEYNWLLWEISANRGGGDFDGSCIWADVYEHLDNEFIYNLDEFKKHNIYQIFGHSYCKQELITNNFAMLDCKTPFLINCENNEIVKLNETI